MLCKKEYNNLVKERDLSKVYFLYFLILVGLILFRILSSFGLLSFFGDVGDYLFTFVIQVVILFGLSFFWFGRISGKSKNMLLKEYKFKKISKKSLIIVIFMGIVVYFLNSFVASFFYFLLSLFGFRLYAASAVASYPIWLFLLNLLFTAVLPAICEETAHRGMLLSQISKNNVTKAIVISSLLFGLLHINIYQFFYATILGFLLAKITLDSGSIFPAMIIHFMNNALNVYMSFATANNLLSAKFVNLIFTMVSGEGVLGLLSLSLFVVFLLLCLRFLYQELKVETFKANVVSLKEGLGKMLARAEFFEGLKDVETENRLYEQVLSCDKNCKKTQQNQEKNIKKQQKQSIFYEKLFFLASFCLASITTIFTFVWGVI